MKPTTRSLIKYRGEKCLNCSTPLDNEDKYCHQCGQLNSTKKLALKDFFGEFFSNIFSYDSRIWRTIKHLLFKPGYVSKEFIAGKRLSYANPFRFFLSVCIMFFLMIQIQEFVRTLTDDQEIKLTEGFDIERNATRNQVTEEELKEIEAQPFVGKHIANEIRKEQEATLKQDSLNSKKKKNSKDVPLESLTQKQLDSLYFANRFIKQLNHYGSFTSINDTKNVETALAQMGHDNTKWNRSLFEKALFLNSVSDNPGILGDIILPKLPIFLFLFTPFLTLFLWILYARRNFTYMEHLIFAFNVFTFIFLSMIVLFSIKWISLGYINLIQFFFLFIGPFYLYKAMRNFYGQRRFKTILKFLSVSFTFLLGLSIGVILLLLIGIALY